MLWLTNDYYILSPLQQNFIGRKSITKKSNLLKWNVKSFLFLSNRYKIESRLKL